MLDLIVNLPEGGVSEPLSSSLTNELRRICTSIIESWKSVKLDEISIKVIPGGITNTLFRLRICHALVTPATVVVRVYGPCTEVIIDRGRERDVNDQLAAAGFGKRMFGEFRNGRVEQWLEGRSLDPPELLRPQIFPKIAARVAELHRLKPISPLLDPHSSGMWAALDGFVKQSLHVSFDTNAKTALLRKCNLRSMKKELEQLRPLLESQAPSPVVFAHNDLLSGNIIITTDKDKVDIVNFIDFEYGAYNFRAFDIANHFCEMCGFGCDWDAFPGRDLQSQWLRAYLASFHESDPDNIAEDQVQALFDEVQPWTLASHLWWGFWAVVQADVSPIDFDFLTYAVERFSGFVQHKSMILSILESGNEGVKLL